MPSGNTSPSSQTLRFSEDEKSRLTKLWKTFHRSVIDIKNSDAEQKLVIPDHPLEFCRRLYSFLVEYLEYNLPKSSERQNQAAISYLKRPNQSSLMEFYRVAMDKQNVGKVRLQRGRCILSLPHVGFLEEFNQYELRGKSNSQEFVNKYSYGAFLHHRPNEALCALGCAMALALTSLYLRQGFSAERKGAVDQYVDSTQLVVRFLHVEPLVPLKDIKTGSVGKFVAVKGHVVKARTPRLRVATADFLCTKCGGLTVHAFDRGRYSIPTKCWASADCRSRTFQMHRPTARYINVQEWRLQEAPDETMVQAGRAPRQIVLEMASDDLVQAARPGDLVLVAATVAAMSTAAGQRGKRAQETSTYQLYLIGHSVTTLSESREQRSSSSTRQEKGVVYTQQQLGSITRLCHADHRYFGLMERRAFPFDLLVRSLCPSIIGHNEVKAGLLLCLLGGTPPNQAAGERENAIRSNSHILIVGDPGMGKSQVRSPM